MIDALASHPHYVDHLLPVWNALPAHHRGRFVVRADAVRRASEVGLRAHTRLGSEKRLTLVAATIDYRIALQQRREVAFLNHGVGQAWRDARGQLINSGCGSRRPGVVLFLTPGPHATATTREANPGAHVVEVGSAKVESLRLLPAPTEPLLVVSTHWDHTLLPESRSALPEYAPVLRELASRAPLALHAHPRARVLVRNVAERLGVPFIESFDDVCRRATAYAVDSSSTLFEFAALDRPVIVLNGKGYRRDHHHGLRFWEAAGVGLQVDDPADLIAAAQAALYGLVDTSFERRRAVGLAYHQLDGCAAQRAASALTSLLD